MRKEDVPRVSPEETRRRMDRGEALLVCAYESDEMFASNHLEGAESFNGFQARRPDISLDQEIILYCA